MVETLQRSKRASSGLGIDWGLRGPPICYEKRNVRNKFAFAPFLLDERK
jgi:hypothetical protein